MNCNCFCLLVLLIASLVSNYLYTLPSSVKTISISRIPISEECLNKVRFYLVLNSLKLQGLVIQIGGQEVRSDSFLSG